MKAIVTTGIGGFDRLELRDVPVPEPRAGEVLLRVRAAGVNNTDVNTRLGWYSSDVTTATDAAEDGATPSSPADDRTAGGWNGATPFPLIQGTDCCGSVDAVGPDVDPVMIGRRVLVRPCMRPQGFGSMDNVWLGSNFDGAFAEYVRVPASEVFEVRSDWTDEELATIPCAYGTAENMLHRSAVAAGDTVLVAGASGGVGSAVVQLARRRGATVVALTSAAKMERVRELGADQVLDRDSDPVAVLGEESVDVVVDNVGGGGFAAMLTVLHRGGRYVSSGAIAGPIVSLDLRTMYLKDLTLIGSTAWDEPVFPNLIAYIERSEIRPIIAGRFPLERIVEAQQALLKRTHVGKFVLAP